MGKDNIFMGIVLGLGTEIATALLIWLGLVIANEPVAAHPKWFAACFIAPILILRHYASKKRHPVITKTLMTVMFITFIAFIFLIKQSLG